MSGGEVGDRNADAHRPLARQAGDRHQPAHALRDLVEAGPVGIRPILAETGNAGVNDARIDLGEGLVVDAEPLLHVGPEILHHDVGFLDHALEGGQPRGRFQVQRHAALVAMQILKVAALARPAHRFFDARRRLDLDDVGAPVGELAHAGRSRPHAGEIEHGKSRKRLRSAGKRHKRRLPGRFVAAKFLPAGAGTARTSPILSLLSTGSGRSRPVVGAPPIR